MNVYLVSTPEEYKERYKPTYTLDSYYYIRKKKEFKPASNTDKFMLDSGAFTFMSSAKNIDWDGYLEEYAQYIIDNDIKLFYELDIDVVVGVEKTNQLRTKLEELTGKMPIVVWHSIRGLDAFKRAVDRYDYVALGCSTKTAESNWTRNIKLLRWFIDYTHNHNKKIHGLGFTRLKNIKLCNFDSVDSTTWMNGTRYGEIHKFENGTIKRIPNTARKVLEDNEKLQSNNFYQWVLFQRYAKDRL